MDDQISLPGFDNAKPSFKPAAVGHGGVRAAQYNLFLAIVPQPADAQRLGLIAAALREQHHLLAAEAAMLNDCTSRCTSSTTSTAPSLRKSWTPL
jgi:hypothetical protein